MSTATIELRPNWQGVRWNGGATVGQNEPARRAVCATRRVPPQTSSSSPEAEAMAIDEEDMPAWSFRLTDEGINNILLSIESLAEEGGDEDEHDGYPVVPSEFARIMALDTIKRAGALVVREVPTGSVCADVNGGIRITWRGAACELRLVIPGEETGRAYLYIRHREKSDISENITPDALAAFLSCLNQE